MKSPSADVKTLKEIQKHLNAADELFSKLSDGFASFCLDSHKDFHSLNHCIRWGVSAASELVEQTTGDRKIETDSKVEDDFECKFRRLLDKVDIEAISAMSLREPGGVTKIATSKFFVFEIEGEDVILNDEIIAEIEASIGLLERIAFPNYELEESLKFSEATCVLIKAFFAKNGATDRYLRLP